MDALTCYDIVQLSKLCPAKFYYQKQNPAHKACFDFGWAMHKALFDEALYHQKVIFIDAENYRTKAAQEARNQAINEGLIPLLMHESTHINEIKEAFLNCADLKAYEGGQGNIALNWSADNLPCYGQVDWEKQGVLLDYKTTRDASPQQFRHQISAYGYDQHAAWLVEGWEALGKEVKEFYIIAQEKEPPYLTVLYHLPASMIESAKEKNKQARKLYKNCIQSGFWPGYGVQQIAA